MTAELLAPAPVGVDESAWLAACGAVRGYCGWHVAPSVAETVTVDGVGGDSLFLPTLHLTALTSITSDGVAVTDPEWSEAGMVRGPGWSRKFRGIVAEITHGYDECPPEILSVLNEMVATAGLGGVSSVTSGPHQVQFEAAPNSRQRHVLDRYRLPTLP